MELFELQAVSIESRRLVTGGYRVWERSLGIYDSPEKAERVMLKVIRYEQTWQRFFGFFVFEKTLNFGLRGPWEGESEFQSVRAYLPDGTFYCDSPYDDTCRKPFRGRPAEKIPLKVGDLAWCWWYGEIQPCLVAALPMTDVCYQECVRNCGEELGLDYVDDSYTVYIGGFGHTHPECWRCMPYYGKISKRCLQSIHSAKRREEAEREKWQRERKKEGNVAQ